MNDGKRLICLTVSIPKFSTSGSIPSLVAEEQMQNNPIFMHLEGGIRDRRGAFETLKRIFPLSKLGVGNAFVAPGLPAIRSVFDSAG